MPESAQSKQNSSYAEILKEFNLKVAKTPNPLSVGVYRRRGVFIARQCLFPHFDIDVARAWRNGHNGIDLEEHPNCGQIPIFILKATYEEIHPGDWIVCEDAYHQVVPQTMFNILYEFSEENVPSEKIEKYNTWAKISYDLIQNSSTE